MSNLNHLNRLIEVQTRLMAAHFNLKSFMQSAVDEIKILTHATGAVIELVEGEEMVYKSATGTMKKYVGLRLYRGESISGLCVAQSTVLSSKDTEKDLRVDKIACRKVQARSLIVAPLFHKGTAIGVLKVISKKPNAFKAKDIDTLKIMAGLIAFALAYQIFHETTTLLLHQRTEAVKNLKNAQRRLQRAAHYDNITGLPNRRLFNDRLNLVLCRTQRVPQVNALMYLDIDYFKIINDNYGHAIGDIVLKNFAKRLKKSIRAIDTAARLGGDEFIVILDGIKNAEGAMRVSKRIIKEIGQPIVIKNVVINITTSIGITFFRDNSNDIDELIKQADEALYMAKKSGRNTIKVFK